MTTTKPGGKPMVDKKDVANPGWKPSQVLLNKLRGKKKVTTWGVASSGQVSKSGSVTQIEHWDDRVDATVRPAPFRLRIQPAVSPADLEDFKQATRELATAMRTQDQQWIARAQRRWEVARIRIEHQGD